MDHTLQTRYTSFLEQQLTPARLKHSLGVMQVMRDLAEIYAPNRVWDREIMAFKAPLHKEVYAGRMFEGALIQTNLLIALFTQKGFPVHPNISQANQVLSSQSTSTFYLGD